MRSPPPAATDVDAPLPAAEFAALLDALGPFESRPTLAAAVSGGPDSTALALLAAGWAHARGGEILALIVDHGLRPEAAAEATQVAGRLASVGIGSRILHWDGAKPATGIQAAARAARYRLLEGACRSAGILHLLLGHQREDQAETVAMRVAGGSGPTGRAGMPVVSELAGMRLLRPLLAVPKSRLVATLRAAGQSWQVDPSNLAPGFHRARLRQDRDFDAERWWRDGLLHAGRRTGSDLELADWLARHMHPHPLGFVRLDRAAWAVLAPAPRRAVLGRAVTAVGGSGYPLRSGPLEHVVNRLSAALSGGRWTAGGCLLGVRREELLVTREPGRIRDRARLPPDEELLWDGRFLVADRAVGGSLEVAALGVAGCRMLPGMCRTGLRSAGVPAAAVAALPAFWHAGELIACPLLAAYGMVPQAGFAATAALRPASALAAAAFAGVNVVSKPQRLI